MIYTRVFDSLSLSRLVLGTVQFGMPYGIANTLGQPSYESVREILACAIDGGVNCLDTAAGYAESEAVLGRALAELGATDKVVLVSKFRYCDQTFADQREVEAFLEASVVNSLRVLRLDSLPVCLFHREEDYQYWEAATRLQERGLIRHLGVSVMTPDAANAIIGAGKAEAMQIPLNLLDHRYTRQGVCAAARARGMALFARSVYLQGLLLMPEEKIPPQLATIIPLRRQLTALADDAGMPLAELAMRYAISLDTLTSVLVGVDSLEQLRVNLAQVEKGPLDATLIHAIETLVPDLPDLILKPNLWFPKSDAVSTQRR